MDRAVRRLEEDGVSLHALINNAVSTIPYPIMSGRSHDDPSQPTPIQPSNRTHQGIGSGVPFDWASLDEYERCMQVNFISVVRLVKACLPLLKQVERMNRCLLVCIHYIVATASSHASPSHQHTPQSKGRIINLSSIAGLAAIPFESPYVASKHALEAFSTCIRAELQPFGIKVITCNPTPHETPINAAGLASFERAFQALSPGKREEYGQDYFDAVFKLGRTFFKGGCVCAGGWYGLVLLAAGWARLVLGSVEWI